jgi:hypothetical protein
VRPALGIDASLRPLLNSVVADGGGSAEALLDVTGIE